ncbi:MAG: hypothetical protein E5V57_14105, partial [Mesorhizobium sp.]
MTAAFVRRLLQAVMVMFAMTVIVFIAINVIGDPVDILISPDADQIERARVRRRMRQASNKARFTA